MQKIILFGVELEVATDDRINMVGMYYLVVKNEIQRCNLNYLKWEESQSSRREGKK